MKGVANRVIMWGGGAAFIRLNWVKSRIKGSGFIKVSILGSIMLSDHYAENMRVDWSSSFVKYEYSEGFTASSVKQ